MGYDNPPVIGCRECKLNVPVERLHVRLGVNGARTVVLMRGKCNCGHTTTAVMPVSAEEDARLRDALLTT